MIDSEGSVLPDNAPAAPATRRDQVYRRVHLLKRTLVAGTLVCFVAIWGLVANHAVGVTAQTKPSTASQTNPRPPSAPAYDPNGFFGDGTGGSGAVGPGGGSPSGPVMGSGGS